MSMRQSTKISKKKNKDYFLNRNLFFNKSAETINEYYLHTMKRRLTKKEMLSSINQVMKERKKDDSDSLIFIHKGNFIESNFEDGDYHINFLGCHLCKEVFKTFCSLFIHMRITHSDFQTFHLVLMNKDTNLEEAHIVTFPNESSEYVSEEKTFFFKLNKNEQKLAIMELLEKYYINNEKDVSMSSYNNSNFTLGGGQNKNDKKNAFKKYDDCENPDRIYFHSVTGEILNEDSEDSDYEIDEEEVLELENKYLDDFIDICDSDKEFFKLWNRFITLNPNISISTTPNIVKTFITNHGKDIYQQGLNQNLILHLTNLCEHQQLNSNTFAEAIQLFENFISNKK